jgi:hypothetical protein
MPQPITIITSGICFVVLFLRMRSRPKDGPRSSRKQKLKLAKVLVAALLAWIAIRYSLQHTIAKIDGTDQEPTTMERVVSFFAK